MIFIAIKENNEGKRSSFLGQDTCLASMIRACDGYFRMKEWSGAATGKKKAERLRICICRTPFCESYKSFAIYLRKESISDLATYRDGVDVRSNKIVFNVFDPLSITVHISITNAPHSAYMSNRFTDFGVVRGLYNLDEMEETLRSINMINLRRFVSGDRLSHEISLSRIKFNLFLQQTTLGKLVFKVTNLFDIQSDDRIGHKIKLRNDWRSIVIAEIQKLYKNYFDSQIGALELFAIKYCDEDLVIHRPTGKMKPISSDWDGDCLDIILSAQVPPKSKRLSMHTKPTKQ